MASLQKTVYLSFWAVATFLKSMWKWVFISTLIQNSCSFPLTFSLLDVAHWRTFRTLRVWAMTVSVHSKPRIPRIHSGFPRHGLLKALCLVPLNTRAEVSSLCPLAPCTDLQVTVAPGLLQGWGLFCLSLKCWELGSPALAVLATYAKISPEVHGLVPALPSGRWGDSRAVQASTRTLLTPTQPEGPWWTSYKAKHQQDSGVHAWRPPFQQRGKSSDSQDFGVAPQFGGFL